MTLNLLKLCVGADSLEDQQQWCEHRLKQMAAAGEEVHLFHVTRMIPKRASELVAGGSLYWVIKGNVQARQTIEEVRTIVDAEGIRRCKLMLGSAVIPTQWQPRRAFQGWRYLEAVDAPPDMSSSDTNLPHSLRAELAQLGLL